MKRISFVMPQLGGGGAERVVSTIISHLNPNEYIIDLVLVHNKGNYLENIPSHVNIIPLKSTRTRYTYYELIKVFRKLEPDIIFSTLRGLSLIILLIKPFLKFNTKIVIREENTVSSALKESSFKKIWELYYRSLFKKADKIICQSNFMKKDLEINYGVSGDNVTKIYNPVDFKMIDRKYDDSKNPFSNCKKNVIIIGRLAYQKGIDILLESIKDNIDKFSNTHVWIIGNGIDENEYKNKSSNLGLNSYVSFIDAVSNPFQWMKYSDLYILPSRYEGLPNVLLEAAACNCKIVTTNHPGGTREIMEIIEKEEYVVEQLNWTSDWFNQKKDIDQMKLREFFSVENIIVKYIEVFEEVIGDGNV